MSIILKGIDLPKASNDDILIILQSNGEARCNQQGKSEKTIEAIQIPTPHGRLIDGDELIEAHYKYCYEHHGEADIFYMWSKDLMDDAPTILEAEE